MSVTRRKFLKSGAMSALAAGIVLNAGVLAFGQKELNRKSNPTIDSQIPYEATQTPTFYFTRDTFAPYVGGIFTTRGVGGHTVNLTLQPVRDCTPKASTKLMTKSARKTDCFALTFRSDEQLSDLTTIYRLNHGALGKFDVFMTQRKGAGGVYFYEAVFNHLVP
jgi:hypothetical protein